MQGGNGVYKKFQFEMINCFKLVFFSRLVNSIIPVDCYHDTTYRCGVSFQSTLGVVSIHVLSL